MTPSPSPEPILAALQRHRDATEAYAREADAHETLANRLSWIQLSSFLLSMIAAGSGLLNRSTQGLLIGGAFFVLFLFIRILQGRILIRKDKAKTREEIHHRHWQRLTGDPSSLPDKGRLFPALHPYASDLDLDGPGSLLQRIDVTHTRRGVSTLVKWLSHPAEAEEITHRQTAVRELAQAHSFRENLEASVLDTGREELISKPFLELIQGPRIFERKPWLRWAAPLLPITTIAFWVLSDWNLVPNALWLLPLIAQVAIVWQTEAHSGTVFQALGARRGFVTAYLDLMRCVETASLDAPRLQELQASMRVDDLPPSAQMQRLDQWVGWYEIRAQGMLHFFINPLLLWDLNCLRGIEKWFTRVGPRCEQWFEAIGEIEALASLSLLLDQDPHASMPTVSNEGPSFEATQLAHPLLSPATRVANDVALDRHASALIVTGSNMAGKSTLLRSVGVNLALALAGGPVIASAFSLRPVRLRASMRIADSLQQGASYFQAELLRLRQVVADADTQPPVFFLLDELLRGTNARARHVGARAVVAHLLRHNGLGLVATHDIALATLDQEYPNQVRNVHFTDVIAQGQMTFDYRLRPGVVKTSNALRLLREVGIEVGENDAEHGTAPAPEVEMAGPPPQAPTA